MDVLVKTEHRALERLLTFAVGKGMQNKIVADFLLAWWDAERYGRFDLQRTVALNAALLEDIAALATFVQRCSTHPEAMGYGEQFNAVIRKWRP